VNHCRLSLKLLWIALFTFKIHSCDKFWPVFFYCFFICFVEYVAVSLPCIFFFSFFRLHLSMSLFFLIQTHQRTPQKQIREHVHPSQLKLKKNTNYCGLEQFLSLEGLLWCFLALSWDSWRFIPCWFIRLVALSRRNIVLVSLQDLSLHRDLSSHQEVWAELALRSLKKNGIQIRKWLR